MQRGLRPHQGLRKTSTGGDALEAGRTDHTDTGQAFLGTVRDFDMRDI